MKRLIAVLAVSAATMLAVPSMASAHGYFNQWYGPLSGGSHNLTINEAIWICGSSIPSGFHGGVRHWGNWLSTVDGWPSFVQQTIGYRANDNSLMKCTLRESYMRNSGVNSSLYGLTAAHQ